MPLIIECTAGMQVNRLPLHHVLIKQVALGVNRERFARRDDILAGKGIDDIEGGVT